VGAAELSNSDEGHANQDGGDSNRYQEQAKPDWRGPAPPAQNESRDVVTANIVATMDDFR
jgi:hypothetical protein